MPGGDSKRTAKWAERAMEWQRLAHESRNEHVSSMCQRFAQSSLETAEFWSKW